MSTVQYTNNNHHNEESIIYHTPYPLEQEREKYEIPFKWLMFDFCKPCLLSFLCLSICALSLWGAMSLFAEQDRQNEYDSTFTISGTCICIHRELNDADTSLYYVVQEFEWIIANHSFCGDTLRDEVFHSERSTDSSVDPWFYNINDTIQCYSNPTCDTLAIDGDLHYDGKNGDNAMLGPILLITLAGCFLFCCFSICGYEIFALLTCRSYDKSPSFSLFSVRWMRSAYTEDLGDYHNFKKGVFRAIHNEREWFDMPFDAKIDYFMNYFVRKYKYRVPIEINDLVNEYWPWCDYTVYGTWNVEEMMVWIGSLERNRFRQHKDALENYFDLKSIKSGGDLVRILLEKYGEKEITKLREYGMSDKAARMLRKHVIDLQNGSDALYACDDDGYFERSLYVSEEKEIRESWTINA